VGTYNKVVDALSQQYGPPGYDTPVWNFGDEKTEPDKNAAVAKGMLTYQSGWDVADVALECDLDWEAYAATRQKSLCITVICWQPESDESYGVSAAD